MASPSVAAGDANMLVPVPPVLPPPVLAQQGPEERKSGLLAPTMMLSGHEAEVLTCQFSPDGLNIASAGIDKTILIYRVYGECENWAMLKGHQNAVLELHWSPDGSRIFTCSADKTVCMWDAERGQRLKRLVGHQEIVNSCAAARRGPQLVASGGDDGTTRIWDMRTRKCVKTFEQMFQALAVCFDDTSERVFTGSLDHTITAHDLRMDKPCLVLKGQKDSITGIDVSKDGQYLVSNSMDNTVAKWDIRPFCQSPDPENPDAGRLMSTLTGATHNFEKNLLRVRWGPEDRLCAAGSADRFVYAWNMTETPPPLAYKLPGHTGAVNEVCFHPKEPIIASCSSDRKVYMGELS
eukprot:Selendium_serpulae@DN6056_c1_g1_i3.p1